MTKKEPIVKKNAKLYYAMLIAILTIRSSYANPHIDQ